MAESGLGAALFIDEFDLSDDTNSVDTLSKSMALLDQTGLRLLGPKRVNGKLSAELTGKVFMNPTGAHAVLSPQPRTDRIASYFHRETLGAPVASIVAKQMNYDVKRAMDGDLKYDVQMLCNGGWLDWGLALTAGVRTDTTATNGDAVDYGDWGAPANFGAQGYLHVKAFTGTSVTITVQMDTASNFPTPTTLLTFAVVSGVTKERVLTSRTALVERYLRVITTGTFSNVQFVTQVTVNTTDMTI